MSLVLALTVPFFALIFLGMFTRVIGFLGADDARTLSKFAFFVALPPMMFTKVAAGDAMEILNWGFIWRYELATIIVFLTGALIGRSMFGLSRLESGVFGMNAGYPNYGYLGVPLVILAFGDAAALPIALLLFADSVVLLAVLACFVAATGGGLFQTFGRAIITMAKNPLVISVVAGLMFSASGLEMPPMVDRVLNLLGNAAPPVALFALGATVYGQPIKGAFAEMGTISLMRLLVHPALVAVLFLMVPGQDPLWIKVAILSACLPVAANVFILSDHYGGYSGRSASAILVTTILASLTVPVVMYYLFQI